MVKQSKEFIQTETFCLAPVLTLRWIQSLVLPSVASQGSPKGGERTGRKGWPLFSATACLCVGRNQSRSCTLFVTPSLEILSLIAEPLKVHASLLLHVAHLGCWITSTCCSTELLLTATASQHRVGTGPPKLPLPKDLQHLTHRGGTPLAAQPQAGVDLTRTKLWRGQCWVFLFGGRRLRQGEEETGWQQQGRAVGFQSVAIRCVKCGHERFVLDGGCALETFQPS